MWIPSLEFRGNEENIRSASHAARDPERSWPATILAKPLVTYEVRGRRVAIVTDAAAVRKILCSTDNKFPKWLPIYKPSAVRNTGPSSVLAVEGEQWRHSRQELAPLFAGAEIPRIIGNSATAATRTFGGKTGEHDVLTLCNRAAVDIIWRTLMGDTSADPSAENMDELADKTAEVFASTSFDASASGVLGLAKMVRDRQPGTAMAKNCPFRHLTAEGGENTSALSTQDAWENLLALIHAGQKTTALSIAWPLWILGQDEELQARVRDEIVRECDGQPLSRAIIGRLHLLTSVYKECMRMLPAPVLTVRTNIDPLHVAGTTLEPGAVLIVPIYGMHRSKLHWDQPEVFKPERFMPGSKEPKNSIAFIPFMSGPHMCLAAKNSGYEMLACLATILANTRVTTHAPEKVKLAIDMTMHPVGPLNVEFQPLA